MPIKIKQKNRHVPEDGIHGDCHRACYAMILEVDLEEIPHFFDEDRDWEQARHLFEEVWQKYGIQEIVQIYGGDISLESVLFSCDHHNRDIPFILGGKSKNGTNHSVVCWKGEIFFDPAIDDSGIVGPLDNGYYWVTYLVGKISHLSNERSDVRLVIHE